MKRDLKTVKVYATITIKISSCKEITEEDIKKAILNSEQHINKDEVVFDRTKDQSPLTWMAIRCHMGAIQEEVGCPICEYCGKNHHPGVGCPEWNDWYKSHRIFKKKGKENK